MITLTQVEIDTFNILEGRAEVVKTELQRVIASRDNFISLLENKYDAVFDPKTGQLNPKEKDKAK